MVVPMKVKAGYRTSEFWFTLVSFVFSGLYLTGLISENSYKEELIEVVSHAVESVILIGGQGLILYRYVKSRSEIKKLAEEEKIARESNKININTASADELIIIKGIGPVLAKEIIKNRPYDSISELKNVKGFGSSLYNKLHNKITA